MICYFIFSFIRLVNIWMNKAPLIFLVSLFSSWKVNGRQRSLLALRCVLTWSSCLGLKRGMCHKDSETAPKETSWPEDSKKQMFNVLLRVINGDSQLVIWLIRMIIFYHVLRFIQACYSGVSEKMQAYFSLWLSASFAKEQPHGSLLLSCSVMRACDVILLFRNAAWLVLPVKRYTGLRKVPSPLGRWLTPSYPCHYQVIIKLFWIEMY